MSPLPPSSYYTAVPAVVLVLLAVTLAATPTSVVAASSSTNTKSTMPPACLRAASTLCLGSSTNALTCLKNLAKAGDSRVSQACTAALADELAGHATASKSTPTSRERVGRVARLLTEGSCVTLTANDDYEFRGQPTCGDACCNSPNNNACCAIYAQAGAGCFGSAYTQQCSPP